MKYTNGYTLKNNSVFFHYLEAGHKLQNIDITTISNPLIEVSKTVVFICVCVN